MMKTKFLAAAAFALLASGAAMAQQAGSWQVGAGWFHLAPQDKSEPLQITSPMQATVAGSGATISNSDTLGLHATYFVTSKYAVEGVLGIPPKFKLNGAGTLAGVGEIGEARQWSPTLLGKYYFGDANSTFRPYVGAGVTYVRYGDVKLTEQFQGAMNNAFHIPAIAGGLTEAKLDSKFAPVVNIGAAYQFNKNWGASFSVSYIPLKTTAKLTTSAGGRVVGTSQTSLKLNPIVPYLALTYTF